MRKSVASVVVVGVVVLATYLSSPGGPQAESSDTFRQLKLFGDVFERVRAEYVEEITDEQLIEAAINGMLTSPERWLQTKAASPSPPRKRATGIK